MVASRPESSGASDPSTAPNSRNRPTLLLSYTVRAIDTGSAPDSSSCRQMSKVLGEMLE
jgi:hypothetical protein